MSEFKGTKGKWEVLEYDSDLEVGNMQSSLICSLPDKSEEYYANALLISKAPCFYEELKETIIDLKILRNQIALESKNIYRWQGMPELIDEWINRKEQLIKEATEI